MQRCWKQDPKERPTIAKIIEWSQLTELKSLRTIFSLESKKLMHICHCHVNQKSPDNSDKPLFQSIIANCESFTPLFSSLSIHGQKASSHFSDHHAKTSDIRHTQIWAAHHSNNGALKWTIITYRSCELGYWVSVYTLLMSPWLYILLAFMQVYEDTATATVQAMTNVYNYMWVSTDDCKLHIIHTANMKTVACTTLENKPFEVKQLLHVPEWHMVLVLWEISEIWCLHDETDPSGVYFIGSLQLNVNISVVNLCRVNLESRTEVWAIREDEITVCVQSPTGCHESEILSVHNRPFHSCNLITCLNFSTATNQHVAHVWVSFNGVSKLICWDGEEKSQLHIVSLKES